MPGPYPCASGRNAAPRPPKRRWQTAAQDRHRNGDREDRGDVHERDQMDVLGGRIDQEEGHGLEHDRRGDRREDTAPETAPVDVA